MTIKNIINQLRNKNKKTLDEKKLELLETKRKISEIKYGFSLNIVKPSTEKEYKQKYSEWEKQYGASQHDRALFIYAPDETHWYVKFKKDTEIYSAQASIKLENELKDHPKIKVENYDFFITSTFNSDKCKKIKGNAIILITDGNIIYFIFNGVLETYKTSQSLTQYTYIVGNDINRTKINDAKSDDLVKIEDRTSADPVIWEALSKKAYTTLKSLLLHEKIFEFVIEIGLENLKNYTEQHLLDSWLDGPRQPREWHDWGVYWYQGETRSYSRPEGCRITKNPKLGTAKETNQDGLYTITFYPSWYGYKDSTPWFNYLCA